MQLILLIAVGYLTENKVELVYLVLSHTFRRYQRNCWFCFFRNHVIRFFLTMFHTWRSHLILFFQVGQPWTKSLHVKDLHCIKTAHIESEINEKYLEDFGGSYERGQEWASVKYFRVGAKIVSFIDWNKRFRSPGLGGHLEIETQWASLLGEGS